MGHGDVEHVIREPVMEAPEATGYYTLLHKTPWWAKFGWWLASRHMFEYHRPIQTYVYTETVKRKITDLFMEAANDLLENNWGYHTEDYLFLCGQELFDGAMVKGGIRETMMFNSARCCKADNPIREGYPSIVTQFGFQICVVPNMRGYVIIPKSVLQK